MKLVMTLLEKQQELIMEENIILIFMIQKIIVKEIEELQLHYLEIWEIN